MRSYASLEDGLSWSQVGLAVSEYAWPALSLIVGGSVGTVWRFRKRRRLRVVASLDRTAAASVEVKGLSRSLRQEGVPDAERHQLIIEVWRRNLELDDPPPST